MPFSIFLMLSLSKDASVLLQPRQVIAEIADGEER